MEMKSPYTDHQKYTDEGKPIWKENSERFANRVRDCSCKIDDLTFGVNPNDPNIISIYNLAIYPATNDTVLLHILVLFWAGKIASPHRIAKFYTLDRVSEDLMLYPSALAEKVYRMALADYKDYIKSGIEKLMW